ncbi:Sterol regulatory element-binding protein 1 [Sphaceloma murrayae]|uniref:Sterol regulatory element-binding protein 1 n=1 Tax=Sphaceloma murrayae TaxID=2082308 RepID=A0A2K1QXQ6_9PEZI|nr:Sterol regulatory element-binding protein 1 [Sphaceloma murrayae]
MPATNLPPTPAASLDISGKIATGNTPSLSLGPAAVGDILSERSSATPSVNDSESSYHPASPVSPHVSKRKQPTVQTKTSKGSDDFNLPPPPSRSRKIIQMKPQQESSHDRTKTTTASTEPATTSKGGRKRANNVGTVAGRKIARKTAHSLIERRRRSKMNEEFGVLKDMIPACRGQEMHKLAILQASIDYLRYLESCISELKTNQSSITSLAPAPRHPDAMDEDPPSPASTTSPTGSVPQSAQTTRPPTSHSLRSPLQQLPPLSHITTAPSAASSPAFVPIDSNPRIRQFSLSTASSGFSPYILPESNATSPVFSPQQKGSLSTIAGDAMQRFSLTSPALEPHDRRHDMRPVSRPDVIASSHHSSMSPMGSSSYGGGQGGAIHSQGSKSERSDREAMAALLMLNSDRRSTGSIAAWREGASAGSSTTDLGKTQEHERKKGNTMSVKDLLSS